MPTYLLLMKSTAEGGRKISDIGSRYESFKKALKKAGSTTTGVRFHSRLPSGESD